MELFKAYRIPVLCLFIINHGLTANNQQRTHRGGLFGVRKTQKHHSQVQLKNGPKVFGTINKTLTDNKVYYSYRGIPFAEPPIGNLRFKPPVPVSSNSTPKTIHAFYDAPPCVQSELLPTSVIGSEDCLYINVYVPKHPKQNATFLPVMVWIFGGAFVVGDGTSESYGPDYFLDEGTVIIVTFNYRVGIFGFLSTEDDASPGNYGLKDQLLALRWIKTNIQSFGGNPEEITIFGESAGSASVSYLTQTPLSKGLFRGAIMESGTTLNLWALTRNPRSIAVATAKILKVDTTTSQTLVEGLRKIDYKQLQIVEQSADYGELLLCNPLNGLPFGPTIEPANPGAIVVTKSHEHLENGGFHDIPYVIGLNSLESIPFVNVLNLIRWYLIKYDLGPTALVPASMNIDDPLVKDIVNLDIKAHYFGLTPVTFSEEQLLKFTTETEFNRPIIEAVRLYSQKAPVYMYQFSYQGSDNKPKMGVGHAEELYYLWTLSGNNKFDGSMADILTKQRMVKFWTNFARTGNPTPEDDALFQNVKWPLASDTGKGNIAYLNIDNNLTTSTNPDWTEFTYWKKLFNEYGNPPYSTY